MKYKTSELAGGLLDAAVAQAMGFPYYSIQPVSPETGKVTCWLKIVESRFSPSNLWEQGGPIIERERIELTNTENGWYAAVNPWAYYHKSVIGAEAPDGEAETPLMAAMRAFVGWKIGADVVL